MHKSIEPINYVAVAFSIAYNLYDSKIFYYTLFIARLVKMDCFSRADKSKKLTDAQKGRIISLRYDGNHSIESIARLADTSVSIY